MYLDQVKNEKTDFETVVKTDISHGYVKGRLDTAIIEKERGRGLIISKIDNIVAAFDIQDLIKGKFFALNYKELSSPDEAYSKMMKWIGKMCKKSPYSRYFNHKDPYGFQRDIDDKIWTKDILDELIRRIDKS